VSKGRREGAADGQITKAQFEERRTALMPEGPPGDTCTMDARSRSSSRKKSGFRKSTFDQPCQIKGYLEKKSTGVRKRWQKRYFEVAGHYLKYSQDEGSINNESTIKSAIDLSKLTKCERQGEIFTLKLGSETCELQGPNDEEAQLWCQVLKTFLPSDMLERALSQTQTEFYKPRALTGARKSTPASPSHVNEAKGDYHEIPTSVTTVAGKTFDLGPLDPATTVGEVKQKLSQVSEISAASQRIHMVDGQCEEEPEDTTTLLKLKEEMQLGVQFDGLKLCVLIEEPNFAELLSLLQTQLSDSTFEVHSSTRWVLATRVRDTFHSDSTNPQSEHNVTIDLYDLQGFKNQSLFVSCYSKSFSRWLSRGGSSGSIGSVEFAAGNDHSDDVVLIVNGKEEIQPSAARKAAAAARKVAQDEQDERDRKAAEGMGGGMGGMPGGSGGGMPPGMVDMFSDPAIMAAMPGVLQEIAFSDPEIMAAGPAVMDALNAALSGDMSRLQEALKDPVVAKTFGKLQGAMGGKCRVSLRRSPLHSLVISFSNQTWAAWVACLVVMERLCVWSWVDGV
jgi:hypothetical protein